MDMLHGFGANKDRAFKSIQDQAPPTVVVVRTVESSDNEVSVQVMGTWPEPNPAESSGVVHLVNELGGWKVDRHEWEPRRRTTPQIASASVKSTASVQTNDDATRMRFPSSPVQGKLNGDAFAPDSVSFSGETITFSQGETKLEVVLPHGAMVAGRSVAVTSLQQNSRHKFVIYKNGERTSSLKNLGSSLRLHLGELKNNTLSGYIIAKYPEQNTEIGGYFYAKQK